MINRFAGVCTNCGGRVAAGAGIANKIGSTWQVVHQASWECQDVKGRAARGESDRVMSGIRGQGAALSNLDHEDTRDMDYRDFNPDEGDRG